MQLKPTYYILLGLGLFAFACGPGRSTPMERPAGVKSSTALKYAERFGISKHEGYTLVYLFGKRESLDTTATYVIAENVAVLEHLPKTVIFVKSPCRSMAALSTIYASVLCELGALDKLTAIDNSDYVINPLILAKYQRGELQELSKGPEPDLEKTIALRPDIVFTFGMGEVDKDVNPKLAQSGIPVAISLDHLERSPLARAEWIKFYAVFAGKEGRADSLFDHTEKSYLALQAFAKQTKKKPSVFDELKYGDTWYMPGGKSYVAQLLKDAGADYIWKDDSTTGSFPLSFEQVYAKARDADFWINLSMVQSKAELLGQETRYAEFKAFKTNSLYNNNKVVNAKGYSTYWETGMIYPDRILSDLISIFHPGEVPPGKTDLYYYRQIK